MKRFIFAMILAFTSLAMPSYGGNDSVCSITVDLASSAQPMTFQGILTTGSFSYTLKVSLTQFDEIKKLDRIYVKSRDSYRGAVTNLEVVGGVIIGYTVGGAPFVVIVSSH
jgi:hypothetical protein